jgi:hypothetical protein
MVQEGWIRAEAQVLTEEGVLPEGVPAKPLAKAAWFGTLAGVQSEVGFKLVDLASPKESSSISGKTAEESTNLWLKGIPGLVIAWQDAHPTDRSIRMVMPKVQVMCNSCADPQAAMGTIFGALIVRYQSRCHDFQMTACDWPLLKDVWATIKDRDDVVKMRSEQKSSAAQELEALRKRMEAMEKAKAPKEPKPPKKEPAPPTPPDPNSKRSKAKAEKAAKDAADAAAAPAAAAPPAQQTAQTKLSFAATAAKAIAAGP